MPPEPVERPVLLADFGGTHARLSLARDGVISPATILATADFEGPAAAIRAYLAGAQAPATSTAPAALAASPARAALACAGPVEQGAVQLTNNDWRIEAAGLEAELGFDQVVLLNDFAAVAWAVPTFSGGALLPVGGGTRKTDAPAVVLGPGTGLGLAGYIPHRTGAVVVVGEGGHVTMAPATDREAAVLDALRHELGHVSAERLLSGNGLERLYGTLARLEGASVPPRTAAGISDAALAGSCPVSEAALDMFCAMLGTVAGNAALTFGAHGGIYIAGGIVPRIAERFAASEFRERFEAKGRFRDYLARIPTSVVLQSEPAFPGLLRALDAAGAP